MSAINQKQALKLQQKLSPQQIQMIKLLELPSMQLEQRVRQEIEENPVLDDNISEEQTENEEGPQEVSVEEVLKEDDIPSYKMRANNYSKDDKQRPLTLSDGVSLHDYLEEQLNFRSLNQRWLAVAEFIVCSIDDDGYLRRDLPSMCNDIAIVLGFEIDINELTQILNIVQELEPAGIGARNLQECLMLQIMRITPRTRVQEVAEHIIAYQFDEFIKKHYDKLKARLNCPDKIFREAIDQIHNLSPKPGNLYSDASNDTAPYIMPDFILDWHDGRFDLRLNSYNIPELKINRRYVEMIREMVGKGDTQQDQEALRFVKNKIDSAKWFISAIKQRHDTLLNTMNQILDYQREYFVDGNQSKLRPMILKDIADRTGLDVSTVSRVVNSKYVQTNFGIIPLKRLFSEAMQTDSGEEVSSYEIKNILRDCIDNEDKGSPLTDEALMDILNTKGYHIARRTVAKYREMLKIPVARLRRQL